MKVFLLILFIFFFSKNLFAFEIIKGNFTQGSLIIGKEDPKKTILINKKKIKISEQGYFVFGINYDQTGSVRVESIDNNNLKLIKSYKILKRKYDIQKIDGLPENMVTPNEEELKRIERDNELIRQAKETDSNLSFFFNSFEKPLEGTLTGVYGSRRILNGQPRTPHFGIDISAPNGTPVKSSNDGIVKLSEKDLYFTGGTILIDHGHGVSTVYSHLGEVLVKKDALVHKGQVIGKVGATGRVTGPHLDFRINWFDIRIDPRLVLNY